MDIQLEMKKIGQNAKAASEELACASADQKQKALENAAEIIWEKRQDILVENHSDLKLAKEKNLSSAMLDRLLLDETRIKSIVDGLRSIAAQNDPIGAVLAEWEQPSGLNIQRVRTPLGVIGVIYESRPNVTSDVASLCFKSGNTVILKGGSEAFYSNLILSKLFRKSLRNNKVDENFVQFINTKNRKAVDFLLENKTNLMVGLKDVIMELTPLEKAIKGKTSINKELLRVSDIMSI